MMQAMLRFARCPPLTLRPPRAAQSRRAGRAGRATLTPETWIEAATEVLVDQGIDTFASTCWPGSSA